MDGTDGVRGVPFMTVKPVIPLPGRTTRVADVWVSYIENASSEAKAAKLGEIGVGTACGGGAAPGLTGPASLPSLTLRRPLRGEGVGP